MLEQAGEEFLVTLLLLQLFNWGWIWFRALETRDNSTGVYGGGGLSVCFSSLSPFSLLRKLTQTINYNANVFQIFAVIMLNMFCLKTASAANHWKLEIDIRSYFFAVFNNTSS